jgi:hypothetical protein
VRYSQPTEEGASAILRLKTPLVAVLALGLLAAACGDDLKPPSLIVSSPSPPASPAASAQSPATGTLPTSSTAPGTLLVGTASIRLEGDITGDVSLLMLVSPALYSPPPGSTAVVWTDGLQTLGITGDSFVGASDTSTTLSLSLQVRDGAEMVVLDSTAGECTITMNTAIERSFTGSFTCRGLAGSTAAGLALSVNATGTFSASG